MPLAEQRYGAYAAGGGGDGGGGGGGGRGGEEGRAWPALESESPTGRAWAAARAR